MDAIIRRKLSMAQRALDFANAHPVTDSGFTAVVTRLTGEVAHADALGMQEGGGRTTEHAALKRRKALRGSIQNPLLRRLVRIAALASRTHPELGDQFPMPPNKGPNKSFILAARGLLASAIASQDILLPLGLGDNFITALTSSLDQLDATTGTAHGGRSDHVGASADFVTVIGDCKRDVEVLDTYYQAVFQGDADLLAAWASASNVAGPFHHTVAVGPATPPATGDAAGSATKTA